MMKKNTNNQNRIREVSEYSLFTGGKFPELTVYYNIAWEII